MNDTKTKKKMAFPHTLIIILIMIVFAAILTYLIQAGQYDRIEVAGMRVLEQNMRELYMKTVTED